MGRDLARRIEDRLRASGYISPRAHVFVEIRADGLRRLVVAEVEIGDGRRAACSAYEDGLLGNAARVIGAETPFEGIEIPFGGPSYSERVREAAEDLFVEEALGSLVKILKTGNVEVAG